MSKDGVKGRCHGCSRPGRVCNYCVWFNDVQQIAFTGNGCIVPFMAMFPARVNIVFGQRWVLAKKKHGNCPAEIVHVSEVQKQQRFRKKGDYRWLIQDDSRLDGFLIRNDHHPRRALVGGIPLRLEGANKTNANQRWLLVFPNDSPGLHKPFLIKSVQSDMYLVVEEAYQCVILQKDAPEQFWRMHDATRRAESFIPSEPSPQPTSPPQLDFMLLLCSFICFTPHLQKPAGGSSFGGNFSKTAFAAYVFPQGRQLQRDGTQRVEHKDQRQITGLVNPELCQSAHMAYSASSRFQRERLLTNYAQHAEGGVKLATFVTKKPAKRVMSSPTLPQPQEPVEVEMPVTDEAADLEGDEEAMEFTEEMAARAMNGRYYPHPSLTRGTLKLSRPKALAYGVDPAKDTGHACPFFEGTKHRFKDVQSLPEAQLRESMRSLKWKSDENWNNQDMHASLKITHFR
eukprot:s861_g29.t1